MVEVRLDGMLAAFAPRTRLSSSAASIDGVLEDLETRFPKLHHRMRDETDRLRPFVKVFLNGTEVAREALSEPCLRPTDSVEILHSIQGG